MSGDETYPPALRAVFDEAEQLATTCARVEADPPDTDEYDDDPKWAAFVSGRASEILLLVGEVASDWQQGKLSDQQAVQQMEEYLRGLYESSFSIHFSTVRRRPPVLIAT